MQFKIQVGKQTTLEDLNNMIELDKQAYGDYIITNNDFAQQRYLKNQDGLVVIYDGDILVGATVWYPVKKEFLDYVLTLKEFMDDNISPDNVVDFVKDKPNYIFYLDLVVNKDYQGKGIGRLLMLELMSNLINKENEGYPIQRVLGYTVTDGGMGISKSVLKAKVLGEIFGNYLLDYDVQTLREVVCEYERVKCTSGELSNEEKMEVKNLLYKCFTNDPLFCKMFKNKNDLQSYIHLLVDYYYKVGILHIARKKQEIVGASIWLPFGKPIMTFKNLIKLGFTKEMLKVYSSMSISSIIHIHSENRKTEKMHYRRKHNYLCMIGSTLKGAGTKLLSYADKEFNGKCLYVENSNTKANKIFYKKNGYKNMGQVKPFGITVELLIKE